MNDQAQSDNKQENQTNKIDMQANHTTKEDLPNLIRELHELLTGIEGGCMCKIKEQDGWQPVADFLQANFSPEQAFMITRLVDPLNDLVWKKGQGTVLAGYPVTGSIINADQEASYKLVADAYHYPHYRIHSEPYDQRCHDPEQLFASLVEAMTQSAVWG